MQRLLADDSAREVRALVDKLSEAWAAGDADAYARAFAADAEYVVFDGSRLVGREAIAEGHRLLFERWLRGSRLFWESVEVRFPVPEVALIAGKGAVLKRGQDRPSKRRMSVQTLVAVYRSGKWELVAFHNTRFKPFAESWFGKLLARFAAPPATQADEAPASVP